MSNRLPEYTVQRIVELKEQGLSSRSIAEILSVGKTSVNDWYSRKMQEQVVPKKEPVITLFDLETSPSIAACFGRFGQNLSHNNIIREGGVILSAAWKRLGAEKVESVVCTPAEAVGDDDFRVTCHVFDMFEESDIVVAHNAPFDLGVFRARLAIHGMQMHKKVKVIDTYRISKGMRFNSRKLDSLGDYFNAGRKVTHEGIQLWIKCINGDAEALQQMRTYNEGDVVLLEHVYNRLKAFDNNPINLGQYFKDDEVHCPTCGSTDVETTGNIVYTQVSSFEEVVCNSCGHRSRKREQLNSAEKRKNLLMN